MQYPIALTCNSRHTWKHKSYYIGTKMMGYMIGLNKVRLRLFHCGEEDRIVAEVVAVSAIQEMCAENVQIARS